MTPGQRRRLWRANLTGGVLLVAAVTLLAVGLPWVAAALAGVTAVFAFRTGAQRGGH